MIETIIFDMGKVLIPFDFSRGYRALEPYTSLTAEEIPVELSKTDLVNRLESGQIEPLPFFDELRRILKADMTYDQFCQIWSCIFLPDILIPEPFIEKLKDRYRVMVLSNTNAIHFEMVSVNYPILKHFHHLVLSHEVGAMKPEPKIYAAAIANAQCPADRCFFTDDIPAYVEGARKAGLNAEQFLGFEKLQEDLKRYGVTW